MLPSPAPAEEAMEAMEAMPVAVAVIADGAMLAIPTSMFIAGKDYRLGGVDRRNEGDLIFARANTVGIKREEEEGEKEEEEEEEEQSDR